MKIIKFSLLFLGLHIFSVTGAQTTIKLKTINASSTAINGITIFADGLPIGQTDINGDFTIELEQAPDIISILDDTYEPFALQVTNRPSPIDLGTLTLLPILAEQTVIQVDEGQGEDEDQNEDISSLLLASSDLFTSSAAFNWGPLRFRIRGYQSAMTNVSLNGFYVNDPENGRVNWNTMSGLNDVTRNSYGSVSLNPFDFDFGNLGGAAYTDVKASSQRKQLRASYALSNRSYRNRIIMTYSTGKIANGWYFSASGSRRWAEEGYSEGSFYDAWAYYLAASKEFGDKHTLHLMGFGSSVIRGKSSPGINLSYELAGSNYYNSYWGYQGGKKRNARVGNTHLPTGIFQYEYTPDDNFYLTAGVGYQKGRNGGTALNWLNASDPRPDYYQKLPNYFGAPGDDVYDALYERLRNNEDLRQVRWDDLYEVNRASLTTIENADGIQGNNVTGLLANYSIEDRRYDPSSLQAYVRNQWQISDIFSLESGVRYNYTEKDNYKVLEDLLGADFYLDVNRFETDSIIRQSNLDQPNRLVGEGDRQGYSYQSLINEAEFWVQPRLVLPHFEAFIGARSGTVKYQRNGDFRTGAFPDVSLGKSETIDFTEFALKGGVTYKISGRHYLYANVWYSEDAPFFSNTMQSPRTRNTFRDDLTVEKRTGAEAAYVVRTPGLKAKLLGYYTTIQDRIRHQTTFLDNDLGFGEFGNILTTNINQRHVGLEAVVEIDLGGGFEMGLAAAMGQHLYTDRFSWTVYTDNSPDPILVDEKIFSENFFVPGSPQEAFALQLKYNSSKRWFASLTGNYLSKRYLDFYPIRRTPLAVGGLERPFDDDILLATIEQEEIDPAFTLNLFGGKSWRVDDYNIFLTIGVNNLLNDQNIITGGFEQYRFAFDDNNLPDLNRFPNKYYYAYGLNYFAMIAVRI